MTTLIRRPGGTSDSGSIPEPSGWTDPLSGFDGPTLWERTLAKETARIARYGTTATVVVADLTGLGRAQAPLGTVAARDAFDGACRILGREMRTSDAVARIGPLRFAMLLVGTDEVAAINFVDRVTAAFKREIGPGLQLGLSMGWASPKSGQSLSDALSVALVRAAEDLSKSLSFPAPLPGSHARGGRGDPWVGLEGPAAAAEHHRRTFRDRLAFGVALFADLGALTAWAAHLGFLGSLGVRL